MVTVGKVTTVPPETYSNPLQKKIYDTLSRLDIPFERVENSPSHTMEEAVEINKALGGRMAKNIFLTNRQKTKWWLLVMDPDKPFITRDFSGALGIPRVSFAPLDMFAEKLGVESGAANILCTLNDASADIQLVLDKDVLDADSFMLPDATVTSHIKIRTSDLTERLIPATGHQPIIIDLPAADKTK